MFSIPIPLKRLIEADWLLQTFLPINHKLFSNNFMANQWSSLKNIERMEIIDVE